MKRNKPQHRKKQAVQGACNACERIDDKHAQDWTKFLADEPTAITPEMLASRYQNVGNLQTKDLAQPIVNIQNAPAAPDPVGLQHLATLLGTQGLFKDITGLEGTQNIALQGMLGNQQAALGYAGMASKLAALGQTEDLLKAIDKSGLSEEKKNTLKEKLLDKIPDVIASFTGIDKDKTANLLHQGQQIADAAKGVGKGGKVQYNPDGTVREVVVGTTPLKTDHYGNTIHDDGSVHIPKQIAHAGGAGMVDNPALATYETDPNYTIEDHGSYVVAVPVTEEGNIFPDDKGCLNRLKRQIRDTLLQWRNNNDVRLQYLLAYGFFRDANTLIDEVVMDLNGVGIILQTKNDIGAISNNNVWFNAVATLFDSNVQIQVPQGASPLQLRFTGRINATRTGFLPNSTYGVTQNNRKIYLDWHLIRLIRDIVATEKGLNKDGKPRGIFAQTGLYSPTDLHLTWDFILTVAFHELCHWGRLNTHNYYSATTDAVPTLPNAVTNILDPVNGGIEHGLCWETMCYGTPDSYSSNRIGPNVYAQYISWLSGLAANNLNDATLLTNFPLSSQPLRGMINLKWPNLYYYLDVRNELQPY